MKKSNLIFVISLILFQYPSLYFSQDIQICKLLGKNINTVIQTMGKPIHQDRSDKTMECVYYKTNDYQMAFVADQQGVYQIEGYKSYGNKSRAQAAISKMLNSCGKFGFTADTVNTAEFNLIKPKVKMNLSLYENSFSKKYEVKIKANKTE